MGSASFEATSDGFTNVVEGLGFRAFLRNATRDRRAFGNQRAGFAGLQRHE
jgi:hypothetical protein